jgi:hypothetical protein
VYGFGSGEVKEAIQRYFRYYRIAATTTLSALHEFRHPLYLRIFCEAENHSPTEIKQVFLGEQRLFSVLERYLEVANASFSKKVNRATEANLLPSLLRKFAGQLWERNARHLPYADTVMLFDSATPANLDWNTSNTKALLEEELIISRSYRDGGEAVEFTYDLLAGYLIAGEALAALLAACEGLSRVESVAAASPLLARLVNDDLRERHPLQEDILRALAALSPARVRRHLVYFSDTPTVFAATVNALFEMEAKYVRQGEIDEVRRLFGHV